MELPDYLPGNPPMYGVQQELMPHYQGDALVIPVYLNVNPDDYSLSAILKESKTDRNIIWQGIGEAGVENKQGSVCVKIKAGVARSIPAGTYYLAVIGSKISDPKNVATVLFQITLSIVATAGSPYPVVNSLPCVPEVPSIVKDWVYTPITYFY